VSGRPDAHCPLTLHVGAVQCRRDGEAGADLTLLRIAAQRHANAQAAESAHPLRLRRGKIGGRYRLSHDKQLAAQQGGNHQFFH
jgi:hypothetical protein